MTKAIVTGGLGFLGFELCLAFLEEGVEVLAADTEDTAGGRWLEVGRNANITYQPIRQDLIPGFSEARTYINLYDHFTGNKADAQLKSIKKFVEKVQSSSADAFLLLPSVVPNRIKESELTELIEYLKEQFNNHYIVYIPTLFGPHQPETFLFQQILADSDSGLDYVDDTRSAIFVKDAAKAIQNQIKISRTRYVQLTPAHSGSWMEILHLLGKPGAFKQGTARIRDVLPDGLEKVVVDSTSSVQEVLEHQRAVEKGCC
jgi:nucleoside-diphosphate-sugar epimerase